MNDVGPAVPAGPVPLALALLDQRWPSSPVLEDAAGLETSAGLAGDPRYVAGRLTQALAVLLAGDLPAMDPPTALLSRALADAIAWRQHRHRPCARCGPSLCQPCGADWDLADRYHLLAVMLGAVGDLPAPARVGVRPIARPGPPR
jgi:hypothetical protein